MGLNLIGMLVGLLLVAWFGSIFMSPPSTHSQKVCAPVRVVGDMIYSASEVSGAGPEFLDHVKKGVGQFDYGCQYVYWKTFQSGKQPDQAPAGMVSDTSPEAVNGQVNGRPAPDAPPSGAGGAATIEDAARASNSGMIGPTGAGNPAFPANGVPPSSSRPLAPPPGTHSQTPMGAHGIGIPYEDPRFVTSQPESAGSSSSAQKKAEAVPLEDEEAHP